MKSASSNRSTAAWKPLALVSALATLTFPAVAQVESGQQLAPVTVSASRFQSTEAPIGATVITAEQIREAGIGNVNQAIRKIGGVYGRQDLNGASDFVLDLRGFGGASENNMVVMVDGIRISENEQASTLMSSIPIESVERIEIVRGGSSVLYGQGATGGTIQIITKRGVKGTHGSLFAEVGNRNSKEVRASLSKGWDGFSINANVGALQTDNYRDRNALKQENFSGGMQWASDQGRIGMRIDASHQKFDLPGGITWEQFLQNPRQAKDLSNFGSIDSTLYTLFGERRFGNWELAADLSYRERQGDYFSPTYQSIYDGRSSQFSPRARHILKTGNIANEFVIGLDIGKSGRNTIDTFSGSAQASQDSQALYVRDEIRFGKSRIAAGVRHEIFNQSSRGANIYDRKISLNAWDLQGSYELSAVASLFAKVGRSYRIANVDDNSGTSTGLPLNPQTSNDLEVGATLGNEGRKLTAKLFQHKLKNEIYYDLLSPPCFGTFCGANINLDPTKHEGIEIEANARLTQEFTVSGILRHVKAKFTEGPYAGKEMTLIPKNTATLRLNWLPGNGQSANVGVQWIDSQRYAGDSNNACSTKIPSFATLDARYSIRVGTWEFAVTGTNLADKNYFSQAFGACRDTASIYPDAGRAVKLSARKDF
ncbi:MAG: TonB-dependent receptor [Pseudomonadota bacterium]